MSKHHDNIQNIKLAEQPSHKRKHQQDNRPSLKKFENISLSPVEKIRCRNGDPTKDKKNLGVKARFPACMSQHIHYESTSADETTLPTQLSVR